MSDLEKIREIKRLSGQAQTQGLDESVIEKFLQLDDNLSQVINTAYLTFHQLYSEDETKRLLLKGEAELVQLLQAGIVNFYDLHAVNPYVPIAALGPWLVTSHGAVLHDSGGYGMLGLGQNHPNVLNALNQQQVIANVMTASFSQKKMIDALHGEVGSTRGKRTAPYEFLFLNSGSEGVTLASRLSDLNAFHQTKAGAKHEGKSCRFISLKGSFHGRTDRPAQVSDSCQPIYKSSLMSFQDKNNLVTIAPNDIEALEQAFMDAEKEGVFIEAMFMEPVMGEGAPGLSITPEFYQKARELTAKYNGLLIIDSVQAGFRASGYLSLIDYPAFRHLPVPDIEVFSKAINGGQYPLSVIGLNQNVKEIFKVGLYGNTMTANPRALDVGAAVLKTMSDDAIRHNIEQKGVEAVEKLQGLANKYPDIIEQVQGTGLLFCVAINPKKADVVGENGLEVQLRRNGIGVIHGGKNALRFTPHFQITSAEIDLLVTEVDKVLAQIN